MTTMIPPWVGEIIRMEIIIENKSCEEVLTPVSGLVTNKTKTKILRMEIDCPFLREEVQIL